MFAASLIKKLKVDLEEAQAQAQEFDARLETVHRETAVTRKENAFLKEQLSTELERTNRAEKGFKRLEVVYDKQAHRLKQFIYFYAKLSQSYAVSLQDAKKHQHAAKQIIVCWYIKTFRRRKHQRTLLSSITRIQRQAATLVPGGPGIELDESHLDKNENNQYTQSKRGGGEEEEEEKKQKRKAYTALLMEQHKYSTEEHPMVQIHHQVDKLREVVDRYQDVGQKLQEKAFRAEQEKVNLQKALQHERRERERTEQAFKDYVASVRAIKRKNKVLTKKLQSADLGNIHNHRLYHAKRRKEYRMRSIEADKEMQQKDQELKLRSNTITTLIHQVEVLKSRVAHDTRTIKSLVNLIPHQFLANQNYHPSASPVPFSEEAKAQGAEDSNKPNLTNAYLLPEKYAMYDKVNIELRTLQVCCMMLFLCVLHVGFVCLYECVSVRGGISVCVCVHVPAQSTCACQMLERGLFLLFTIV